MRTDGTPPPIFRPSIPPAGNPVAQDTFAGHASSILNEGLSGPGFQGLPTLPMGCSTGATSDHRSMGLWPRRPASRLVSGRSRQRGRRCDPSGRQSRPGAQSLPTTMPSVGRDWGQRALCMPTVVPQPESSCHSTRYFWVDGVLAPANAFRIRARLLGTAVFGSSLPSNSSEM